MKFNIFARIFIDTHFEFGLKTKVPAGFFDISLFSSLWGATKRNYVQVSTWMILNSTFRSNYKAIFLAAKN